MLQCWLRGYMKRVAVYAESFGLPNQKREFMSSPDRGALRDLYSMRGALYRACELSVLHLLRFCLALTNLVPRMLGEYRILTHPFGRRETDESRSGGASK